MRMKKKSMIRLATLSLALLLFAGCTNSTNKKTAATDSKQSAQTTTSSVDLSKVALPQLEDEIQADEALIEIDSSAGKIKIKLFPEIAPKAVENFMALAQKEYYNDTTFHRVIEGFMIQGGDPQGDGTGGQSVWKKGFEIEPSNQLYHIRGALSMARGEATDSQGSQFFIVQNDEDTSADLAIQFTPEKIIEAYKKGGAPQLDGDYTVFGQVTDGMDVVDKIAQAKVKESTSGEKSTPVEPIKIKQIKILQEAK